MGRLRRSEVMMNVRTVMLERLSGWNEGWQRGGVTRMRLYRDNRVVRVLVMGERMRGGMMRLSCGLDVVMMMFLSMRDSRDGGGGVVDNRRWRLIS